VKMSFARGIPIVVAFSAVLLGQATPGVDDWPAYGRDQGSSRYSPLAQLNTNNVSQLKRAWTYHTGETGRGWETTPIFVGGVLYLSTQNQDIVALDPDTGKQMWRYKNPHPTGREHRGVSYWPGCPGIAPRLVFGTGDGRLVELDPKTGSPILSFGDNGIVNLRTGYTERFPQAPYAVSSPPAIYRNVIIVDPATQERPSLGPSADIRAFEVRSGKQLWSFHTVPRPGEAGNDTWGPDGWKDRAGPSQWGAATLDSELGLVFLPTGNPADSLYGADRKGTNLYANSLIALEAQTGKLRWYFQMVHHDIWDYDADAPPALIKVKRDGKSIPAVAEITKMGLLFVLDRRTGKPVFGVEERAVPQSAVPGEQTWPTQPFPVKPVPLVNTNLTGQNLSTRTPEAQRFCQEWFSRMYYAGPYTPWGTQPTLIMPGTMGGGNWGGVSFDPHLGYLFVNTSNLAGTGRMVRTNAEPPAAYRNEGGYTRFLDQDQYPCTAPPWGELSAVNANTGEIVWRRPLGNYDELEARGLRDWGAPNMGGSIVTAGGLVFIAATTDSKFRAFDSRTGRELWVTKLEATGDAVPMTYMGRNGQQYVVIAAGGTNRFRMIANTASQTSDALVAFSLHGGGPASFPTEAAQIPPARTVSALPPSAVSSTEALPEAPGKALVLRVCTKCHGVSVFTKLRMSRVGWSNEVAAMIEKGAAATDQEVSGIVEYLAANFQ
jgi:glucose dehydrogenase